MRVFHAWITLYVPELNPAWKAPAKHLSHQRVEPPFPRSLTHAAARMSRNNSGIPHTPRSGNERKFMWRTQIKSTGPGARMLGTYHTSHTPGPTCGERGGAATESLTPGPPFFTVGRKGLAPMARGTQPEPTGTLSSVDPRLRTAPRRTDSISPRIAKLQQDPGALIPHLPRRRRITRTAKTPLTRPRQACWALSLFPLPLFSAFHLHRRSEQGPRSKLASPSTRESPVFPRGPNEEARITP